MKIHPNNELVDARREMREALAANNRLRAEISEIRGELIAAQDQLEGNLPRATTWLQRKVWRQKRALDLLNRRIVSQRFALRLYESIREPVTAAEWADARGKIDDDRLRDRVDTRNQSRCEQPGAAAPGLSS